MITGFLYILCHLILPGQHSLYVQITGACDKIPLVIILPGQLIADQMASIVKIPVSDNIILHRMPAGRADISDISSLPFRHNLLTDVGKGHATASQIIQLAVIFKSPGSNFLRRKGWL